jgi:hypothetical protein
MSESGNGHTPFVPELSLESIEHMSRDLAKAAATLSDQEARYLVDAYYMMQEDRKRANNQVLALGDNKEPNSVLVWLASQSATLEKQIVRALDKYTQNHKMGEWMRSVYGIGPVLSAGLLAHIDITQAPTAGHIWRFAGMDSTVKWQSTADTLATLKNASIFPCGTESINQLIQEAADYYGRRPQTLVKYMTDDKGKVKMTLDELAKAIARRPWNAALKTLLWKCGQSFMKFSNDEKCIYGKLYRERKAYEVARNDSGGNDIAALEATKRIGKTTDSWAWIAGHYPQGASAQYLATDLAQRPALLKKLKEDCDGKGTPMLPPAQIDARARRWAVKIFISHLQQVWYEQHFGVPAPAPFAIAILGHAHKIEPQRLAK